MTVKAVSEKLNTSEQMIRRFIRERRIIASKRSNVFVIAKEECEKVLNEGLRDVVITKTVQSPQTSKRTALELSDEVISKLNDIINLEKLEAQKLRASRSKSKKDLLILKIEENIIRLELLKSQAIEVFYYLE